MALFDPSRAGMSTVSDTSPLLNLAIIGKLELVEAEVGPLWIPPAVLQELEIEKKLPGSDSLRRAIKEDRWITVRQPANEPLLHALHRDLDQGEAEAIALASELDADLILLDEREGRSRARELDLTVRGVLGILIRGKKAGQIDSLPEVLDQLQAEAGFWIAPELRQEILHQFG